MKVLGIAFEPWETETVCAVHARMKDRSASLVSMVLVGDIYQLIHKPASENLKAIEERYGANLVTLDTEFNEWCANKSPNGDWSRKITEWSAAHVPHHSTGVLSSSDHVFSHFERSPYYIPIKGGKKREIFARIAEKVALVVKEFEPDLVWTIERNYLVKNIANAVCKEKGISFKTLIPSRIETFSYFVDGIGTEKNQNTMSNERVNSMEVQREKEKFYEKINKSHSRVTPELYKGGTEREIEKLENYQQNPVRALMVDLKVFLLNLRGLARNRFGRRIRTTVGCVYTSDPKRVAVWLGAKIKRRVSYTFLGGKYFQSTVPSSPFIFYPLHLRPESSTLTLGHGVTDELCIDFILAKIPIGMKLAIKENPAIVCDRPRSWYRQYHNDDRIVLISPMVSSVELIKKSFGVVGISGTALLEAALLGRPSHCLGSPEFSELLTSQGFDRLESFLIGCAHGFHGDQSDKAFQYVSNIRKSAVNVKPGWESLRDQRQFNLLVDQVTGLLIQFL